MPENRYNYVRRFIYKERTNLRCGEKCFLVEIENDGKLLTQPINARTPAEARKTIRKVYGDKSPVISVRKRNKTRV